MLKTTSEVIDALGGTGKVAQMLGVGVSAVSNYRRQGFPAAKYYEMDKICRQNGLAVDGRIFGGNPPPPRNLERGTESAESDAPAANITPLQDFMAAGFIRVDTPILQPSTPFINRLSADMQRRLYRFTDPGGEELCLRPDLTVPTAQKYVQDGIKGQARYCYQGTAFRYQKDGADRPEEFTQTGIEILGGKTGTDAIEDDIEVLDMLVRMIRKAGVNDFTISLNTMQRRKPDEFVTIPQERLDKMKAPNDDSSVAGRSGAAIRRRIEDKKNYNTRNMLAGADAPNIEETKTETKSDMKVWIKQLAERLNITERYFTPNSETEQKFRYYTGLSFEIRVGALGARQIIASGGRYDDLLQSLGTQKSVPAVGGAIALERLIEAARLQGGQL